jgi:hypothetical protein
MSPVFTRIRDSIECLNKYGVDVTFNMYNSMQPCGSYLDDSALADNMWMRF